MINSNCDNYEYEMFQGKDLHKCRGNYIDCCNCKDIKELIEKGYSSLREYNYQKNKKQALKDFDRYLTRGW